MPSSVLIVLTASAFFGAAVLVHAVLPYVSQGPAPPDAHPVYFCLARNFLGFCCLPPPGQMLAAFALPLCVPQVPAAPPAPAMPALGFEGRGAQVRVFSLHPT